MGELLSPANIAIAISVVTLVASSCANRNKATREEVQTHEARIGILESKLNDCNDRREAESQAYERERDDWHSREMAMLRQLAGVGGSVARSAGESIAAATTLSNITTDLRRLFTVEDIDQMAFDLGLNVDELGGPTLTERSRNMVVILDKRNQLQSLVRKMHELRPEA